ncbi:MAG: hypothetical protein R3300_14850 [Candidatus Promineifilaceae bacterium]|nr:hypothetical protein [Candidatus Promineifilaceae bacterium]
MSQSTDKNEQQDKTSYIDKYMLWSFILGPMIGVVLFDVPARGLGFGLVLGLLIGALMDQHAKEGE